MALKSVVDVDVSGFDDELSTTEIAYLAKNFRNFLRNSNRKCFECQGYGHMKSECPTYLRCDEDGNFIAFTTTAVVNESISVEENSSDGELSEDADLQEAYNKPFKVAAKDTMNVKLGFKKIASLELKKKNLLVNLSVSSKLDQMLSAQKVSSDKSRLGFVESISVSAPNSTNFVPSSSSEPPVSEVVSETVKPVGVTSPRKIRVDLKESKPKDSTLSKDKIHSLDGFPVSKPVHVTGPIGASFLRLRVAHLRPPRVQSSSVVPPPSSSTGDAQAEASGGGDVVDADVLPLTTSDDSDIRRTLDHVLTVQWLMDIFWWTCSMRWSKIIPRNTTLPTSKSEVFSTATDGQTSVDINVFQGEREFVRDNRYLHSFHLDDILLASHGVPQIEVKFCINSNGILSVTAVDKGTGKKQGITIINLPNDYEMQRMVNEAERFAKDYKEKRDAIDTKNQAEFVVYQIENQLKELGETRFLP
ncbi:chaperone protein dnaK [Quercus suber]